MAFLHWLQESGVARYVQEDPWGYPIVLSCHAVGMALLAGIVLMINFRVLGFGRGVPLQYLRRLMGIAYAGLILNLCSGLMLFAADAVAHFENTAFRIKIILLVLGVILAFGLARRIFAGQATDAAVGDSVAIRVTAAISVAAWIGVIVAGRLIAYTGETVPAFLGS